MDERYQGALAELAAVFERIDDGAVDRAVAMIAEARNVIVFGGGRERLQIMGFAMRLFHLGRKVAVVGDMTTPAIGKGDLFVVTVGPGEISTALALLEVARKAGATILVLTAQPAAGPRPSPISSWSCRRRPWRTIAARRSPSCPWARSTRGRSSCSSR